MTWISGDMDQKVVQVLCVPLYIQWIIGLSSQWPRWQAIVSLDMFTEAVIVLIPPFLVVGLNMSRRDKLIVMLAFSARLPVMVAAALRLRYLRAVFHSSDRTLEVAYYAIATQWHVGYAIMSTTITGLGPFLRPFSKSSASSYHPTRPYFHQIPSADASHGAPCRVSQVEPFEMQSICGNSDTRSDPLPSPPLLRTHDQASRKVLITEVYRQRKE